MKLKLRFLAVKAVPKVFWSLPKALTIRPPIISVVVLIFGLILFGLGEALLIASGVGASPWTVFCAKRYKCDGMERRFCYVCDKYMRFVALGFHSGKLLALVPH